MRIRDGMRRISVITAVTERGVKLRGVDTRMVFRFKTGINYQSNSYVTQTDICYLLTLPEAEQIATEIQASKKHSALLMGIKDIHFDKLSDEVLQQVIELCKKQEDKSGTVNTQ